MRVAFGEEALSGHGVVNLQGSPQLAPGHVDLAVLTLAEHHPADAQPVPILPSHLALQEGDRISVAGFGVDERGRPGQLRAADGTVARLRRRGDTVVSFTVDHRGGTGPCFGDSGGPVYVYKPEGVFLVGAVSGSANGPSRCGNEEVEYSFVPGQQAWLARLVELASPAE
jgi:hypothetical protein